MHSVWREKWSKELEKIGRKSVPVFLVEIFIMWYSLVKLKWMGMMQMRSDMLMWKGSVFIISRKY